MFPEHRPRRLRERDGVRRMVRETRLSVDDLVMPVFVDERVDVSREVASMPGVMVHGIDGAVEQARLADELGIPAVMLFGVPREKDPRGSQAYHPDGIVQRTVRRMREESATTVITDLCLCEYTDHGHCGVVRDGRVVNDDTLVLYQEIAVTQAAAGADMVAPSGMMDGMVRAIRMALDDHGFQDTGIMSYSAKYCSAFYGPFRDCADSCPSFGDRRSHQMDPANRREAFREIAMDIDEGADIIMVKPALSYLDVIRDARDAFDVPVAAYNVSGEYSMLMAAEANGWIDGEAAMMESLTSMRRAGADIIITYFAERAARLMGGSR